MQTQQTPIVGRFGKNTTATAVDILKRTKCEIYTRVMGYYRPVSFFNEGKKSEFFSRTCYNENETLNSKFAQQYSKSA